MAAENGVDELVAKLAALKAERGYLLPHHGLLAAMAPDVLEAYGALYRALTFTKEFVWLAILAATDEAAATHHIAKFRNAGGTDAQIAIAVRLAAWARGEGAVAFADKIWSPHMAGFDWRQARGDARAALIAGGDVTPGQALLAEVATRTCLDQWAQLADAIVEAVAAGESEDRVAESLMLTMFPAGVPRFVEAAGVWLELIREGRVTASPRLRAWASLEGQGGHDEASGKVKK
jgi:alkylhydroperoxidase/carboxymuconolactone decarboxylase family protein YurZ